MNTSPRRGVTRGYVGGLIFAVVIVALALLIAAWGGLALATQGGPVSTPGIGLGVASIIIIVALAVLAWGLWSQALLLLRGQSAPPWAHMLLLGAGGYLIWCLGGLLAGLTIQDTWLSFYAVILGIVWAVASLLYWAVLARRVYTERPTPRWPWEKRGEPGPDWNNDNPWTGESRGSDGGSDDGGGGSRGGAD